MQEINKDCVPSGTPVKDTGFGYTLSVIGGKHKMVILYCIAQNENLLRFNELHRMVGTISYKALSSALKELEASGLILRKETYPGVLGGKIEGVQVFSQRLPWPGSYSGHEITLARKDEIIKISVQDHTSDIYMDGVFLTARKISGFPAGSFIRTLADVMKK